MSPAPARVDELKKRYEENPRRFFAPLANEYRKAGDLDAAIDLCRTHLEEQPGHLSGHIVYGQALYESSRTDDAKKAFEAALTLDPENLIALRHLGDIAKGEGDATTATHWYQRVLDADPRNDEVIALIDALKQIVPPPSTVVIAEDAPPPPPPSYAEQAAAERASREVDSSALTPVIPIETVPAALPPAPVASRGSIGLMDLNLDLGDATAPALDLIGVVPPAVDAPAPDLAVLGESARPTVDEAAPAFEEGFPLAEGSLHVLASDGPELLGADDTNLGLAAPDDGVRHVPDTSFGVELPIDEEPTFATTHEPSAFGDSLDVIVASDLDLAPASEPVPEPSPEPAPATAGDFDLLFGNSPIVDVQVGGDSAPAEADAAGFMADSFIGREPSDASLDAAPDVATPPSPFVTETMAELYLQQGFREEALGVYRQLLAQDPGDAGLAERVRHLEHGGRSSLSIDRASDDIEAASVADALRRSESTPAVPAVSDHVPMLADATPAFLVEPPVVEPAPPAFEYAMPAEEPAVIAEAPPPVRAPVSRGPSMRDVLLRIAQRRAVPGGGFARPIVEPDTVPSPVAAYDPGWTAQADAGTPPEAEHAMLLPVAGGGALDRLFGMGGVGTDDEGAATAVAAAFGGAPAAPIRGEPTRQVSDELSLDSVFKDEVTAPAPAPAPAVQRQSTKLRFDQFFAGVDDAAPSSQGQPLQSAPGKGAEDIAQFSDWLKGLKGS